MANRPLFQRCAALALLAVLAGAGSLPHRHSALTDESDAENGSESVQTRHNPQSHSSHWHSVLRTIQEEPCWACHWGRFLGLAATAAPSRPFLPTSVLSLLPPRSAASVARFTRLSRAPPILL